MLADRRNTMAIGEGKLDDLHENMKIAVAVLAQGAKIDAFEQIQHLDQRRALAPEAAGTNFHRTEATAHGRCHLDFERVEILGRKPAAMITVVSNDGARYIAAIKSVVHGAQPASRPRPRSALFIDQILRLFARSVCTKRPPGSGGPPPGNNLGVLRPLR